MLQSSIKLSESDELLWKQILKVIKDNINARSYNTWFAKLRLYSLDSEFIKLLAPNRFFIEWLENHYSNLIQNAIIQVLGDKRRIHYNIESDEPSYNSPYSMTDWKSEKKEEFKKNQNDLTYCTPLNERYSFENFIVGDSNNFATAAAKAVTDAPGKTIYNPLIIYGKTGLGKTHLIQAIGNRVREKSPHYKVYYASSETFTTNFIQAIQQNKVAQFSGFFRSCDVLLIDDVQFFANKGKTQEEFFHTFNDLHQSGKQIILTSDRPINELVSLEERLTSRFKWGLIVDIQPPDFETRLAILQDKCEESELAIPANVLEFLAVNLTESVRELEGALTKIMAQVTFTSVEPNIELARKIVNEIAKPDKSVLSADTVMDYTAQIFNVPKDSLRAKNRKKDIVMARQTAMYLTKKLTDLTLNSIGLHFGGRDHSTVIHSIEAVSCLIQENSDFKNKINSMIRHLEYNK